MRFHLVDRVTEFEPRTRIKAVKAVTQAEEYLGDHFPTFPVLPGVLMLECLVEAGRWLVWASEGFSPGLILLKEAKNVTYKSFVAPGRLLEVEVQCRELLPDASSFQGVGRCGDREVVKARFQLIHRNVSQDAPNLSQIDDRLCEQARTRWASLYNPVDGKEPVSAAS